MKDMTLEKLHDFGILCKVGNNSYPTHVFDLLTDNSNKVSKVQCTLFKGKTRNMFIDKKEFNGPIYEQVDEAYFRKVSNEFERYLSLLEAIKATGTSVYNIEQIFLRCGVGVPFGQINVMKWSNCTKFKATNIMNVMKKRGY